MHVYRVVCGSAKGRLGEQAKVISSWIANASATRVAVAGSVTKLSFFFFRGIDRI